jgi:hypothetical protein
MPMNVDLAQELLNELGESLENLEARHAALFQFLSDQGVVTEEQFAPYLSQAGKASGVRWRATRVRLEHLIEAEKGREEKAAKEKAGEKRAEEKERNRASEEEAPGPSVEKSGEEKKAKGSKDEGGGKDSPQKGDEATKAAAPNTTARGAGAPSGSVSDSEKDEK